MADEEFLSQEEIDMLLQSLGKEAEEEKEEASYKPFNIEELEKISPTRLIKLEQVVNRWVAGVTTELRGMVFNLDSVSLSDIKTEKISEFVLRIPLPAAIAILNVEDLEGRFYLVLDTRLIYTILSIMLGGPAQPYRVEGKSFTKFEQKIIKNLVDVFTTHLSRAWEELVGRGRIEFAGMEENPRRLITVSRNELVIVVNLSVEIETFKGEVLLAIPMKVIEPIKDQLRTADSESADLGEMIFENILSTEVMLDAILPLFKMSVGNILDMKEGDFLPMDRRATSSVLIKTVGVPLFRGVLGESEGRKAVKIEELVRDERA